MQSGKKPPHLAFKDRLAKWYETLILPIEEYLPTGSSQTLTIVPEGLLSQIPFSALCDKNGKYLIERCPISIAPSIKVLQLLDQIPKNSSQSSLIIGNPITPELKNNNLGKTEKEAKIVASLLNTDSTEVLVQHEPKVSVILTKMPSARWVHLACHGELGNKPEEKLDPHSVFEGFFRLSADEHHSKGHLHSEKIVQTALQTELAFMSACHSGRGSLKQEGIIGPNWSFLAAGALSTVASYWPVPEGDTTVRIVATFYKYLLGLEGVKKRSKAQALRKAILMAMKTERDKPRQWAAFFLSGIS